MFYSLFNKEDVKKKKAAYTIIEWSISRDRV